MSDEERDRSFDAPGRWLAHLAPSYPRIAYPLADFLGASRNRITRRWPTTLEIRALFPRLSARDARSIAARIGALNERNRMLVRTIRRHGLDPIRSLVTMTDALASLRGPCILATFHVGALHALGAALERLSSPVLSFRTGRLFAPRGALEMQSTEGESQERAAALHRALVHLRAGGIVVMAVDVGQDQRVETRCLEHTLPLAPGAFALANWARAPIVPIVARWTSQRILVDAGDAIRTPQEAATWLERYLLESPSELTLGLLRTLLGVS